MESCPIKSQSLHCVDTRLHGNLRRVYPEIRNSPFTVRSPELLRSLSQLYTESPVEAGSRALGQARFPGESAELS